VYRDRRDALLAAVRAHLPGCRIETPGGGFFAWVQLPRDVQADALRDRCEARGVSFLTGARFFADGQGGSDAIRLCYALYPARVLQDAVHTIGASLPA
jgi:DNA-binding transcriptional MocR family regulator